MNINITPKELRIIEMVHFLNSHPWIGLVIAGVAIWTLIWKGIALWKAARNGHTAWYVILLLVNTVGILEIIYIFFFSKEKENQ